VSGVNISRRSVTDGTQITGLKDSIGRLSSLREIPFEDEHGLVHRARRIMAVWERAVDM
jgi:hypothetical protein